MPINIGFRSDFLYRFQLYTPKALMSKNNPRDLREIWNRRMGLIHHGQLRFLQEIVICILEISIDHYDACKGYFWGS